MKIRKPLRSGLCCLLTLALSQTVRADEHTDNLAKCLVNATTPAQRTVFIRWMFATMALHPDVAPMANISDSQRESLNKNAADLFMNLLTNACSSQVRDAVLFDGPQALESAFEVLGKSAMIGLMTDDKVTAGMKSFGKYMDEKKLQQVISAPQSTSPSSAPSH